MFGDRYRLAAREMFEIKLLNQLINLRELNHLENSKRSVNLDSKSGVMAIARDSL